MRREHEIRLRRLLAPISVTVSGGNRAGAQLVRENPGAQRPQHQTDRRCADEWLHRGPPAERAAGADEGDDELVADGAADSEKRDEPTPHRAGVGLLLLLA